MSAWTPDELDEILEEAPDHRPPLVAVTVAPEDPPADLPEPVALACAADPIPERRSEQHYHLVAVALAYGLTDGQVAALARSHAPSVQKWGLDGAHRQAEVSLAKLRPKHDHVGRTCAEAGCAGAGAKGRHADLSKPIANYDAGATKNFDAEDPGTRVPAGEPSTWTSVDLAALRDGGLEGAPEPVILRRDDGVALFYDGKIQGLLGESESGKSWVACLACLDVIRQGDRVTYLDFEDDAVSVIGRMLAIGATWEELITLFDYRRPDEPFDLEHLASIQEFGPRLVIVDGITESMTIHDLDPDKNRDSARFQKLVIRPILYWTGAGIVQVDHLGKHVATRGKGAIGAQHKRAAISGVQYLVEVGKPIGRGRSGTIILTVDKDRPGHVRRASAGAIRAGEIHLTSSEDGLTVTAEIKAHARTAGAFRPTVLMEKVSRCLEIEGEEGLTKAKIRKGVPGHAESVVAAIEILVAEEYISVDKIGQAHKHVSVRPYRREDDPLDPGHQDHKDSEGFRE